MASNDYSHRSAVDKLGIKPGHRITLVEHAGQIDLSLRRDAVEKAGGEETDADAEVDVVLISADSETDTIDLLQTWRPRLHPAGGIWLLTPKRGQPGYMNQTELIPAGQAAGMVDNKTCSVSDITSGMRFVIRRRDRPSLP